MLQCGNHRGSNQPLERNIAFLSRRSNRLKDREEQKLQKDLPVIPFKCPSRNIIHCPVLKSHTLPNESRPFREVGF